MAKEFLEVEIQNHDALRLMDKIEQRATLGLKRRQYPSESPAGADRAYALTADGLDVGTFIQLYVDGTWSASANLSLGD